MKQEQLIPDEWIVAYAAGTLTEAKATLVATHISFHPELKEKLKTAEDIGGELLDSSEKASVSNTLFDKIEAALDRPYSSEKQVSSRPLTLEHIMPTKAAPAPLVDYVRLTGHQPKWRVMGPGLRQAKLCKGENGERLWLLKAKGGTEMPKHDHNGQEMTLVLQGSYHVGETRFCVGDLEIAADHIKDHQPMIDEGEDCICLVVTEAPIKLKSMLARVAQPFIGI
ncbi:ChrR family anti-sigma-E factor [Kordiimonas aquimaris]|uniref:ChrR family anti-sigma-E factor n=1 Tax=Kordiimonas aquimaris TaxID=707591 RepID=UPI0021D26465|nr:ChrR family anti-sigma-E factor [Kordiimonas aquimaris]